MPLPVLDKIFSLLAIMLDDNYYQLMLEGRRTVDGVSVLGPEYLILFKMKAWQKKAESLHVNVRDLKKHKNDVFRLFVIADPTLRIHLPVPIEEETRRSVQMVTAEEIKLSDLKIDDYTVEDALDGLKKIFSL